MKHYNLHEYVPTHRDQIRRPCRRKSARHPRSGGMGEADRDDTGVDVRDLHASRDLCPNISRDRVFPSSNRRAQTNILSDLQHSQCSSFPPYHDTYTSQYYQNMTPSTIEDTLLRRARFATGPSLTTSLMAARLSRLGNPNNQLPLIFGFALAGIVFYRLESPQTDMGFSQVEAVNSPSLVNRFLSAAMAEPAVQTPSSPTTCKRDWVKDMLQVM